MNKPLSKNLQNIDGAVCYDLELKPADSNTQNVLNYTPRRVYWMFSLK